MEMLYSWAMPCKNTFSIKPIKKLLENHILPGQKWIDPYSAGNNFATITNDLNPTVNSQYHLEAIDFVKLFDSNSIDGVLFDPPYSIRQVNECYEKVGGHVINDGYYAVIKDEIARAIKPGGKCISFGWDSNGLGHKRGFDKKTIQLVAHGSRHRDTIVVIEKKKSKDIDNLII